MRLAFFRDFHGDSAYKLTIFDCLRALELGCIKLKWFNSYQATKFPQAPNGHLDMDWIIPNQMLAFRDPTVNREHDRRGISKAIIKELRRLRVKAVVRLNGNDHIANYDYYGSSYHSSDFKREGFDQFDIPFRDVGTPTCKQVKAFLQLSESYNGKVAVHCHAGLGRTATMIGCHMIRVYNFDARPACAWIKMCRRGSVMGPQHFYLDTFETQWNGNNRGNIEQPDLVVSTKLSAVEHPPHTFPREANRSIVKKNIIHTMPNHHKNRHLMRNEHGKKITCIDSIQSTKRKFKLEKPETGHGISKSGTKNACGKLHYSDITPTKATTKKVRKQFNESVILTSGATTPKRARSDSAPLIQPFDPTLKFFHSLKIRSKCSTPKIKPIKACANKTSVCMSPKNALILNESLSFTQGVSPMKWSGKEVNGLVTRSRSRINNLISSIYN